MNETIKMRILHLIDLGARYEDSSELKEIIDQQENFMRIYLNQQKILLAFMALLTMRKQARGLIKLLRKA